MNRFAWTIACLLVAATSFAHFPWLYLSDEAYPRLFFGESLAEREYHVPEAVAAAAVWQDGIDAPPKRLTMEKLEKDGYVGLEGDDRIEPRGVVRTTIVYGNYHGSLLTYDAQHFPGEQPDSWPRDATTGSGIEAKLSVDGSKLTAAIVLDGEPLPGAKVSLTSAAGGEAVQREADGAGVVRFDVGDVVDGLNGVMVMHVDPTASGEHAGEPYESTTRILTATFHYSAAAAAKVGALPPVPQALASFGAAVSDGWLYVYGGHIGQAHDHSRDNLTGNFRRVRLTGGAWEPLPPGPALQGLPLVAHDGKLYRIGGLDARNTLDEDEDLHSVAHFACFDQATGVWTDLPPLPAPRSSHNAVVVDNKLYVIGGWALSGDSDGDWQTGALIYDLTASDPGWKPLAEPPFKRRALAVSHSEGRIAVLCGMTDEAKLSKQVFFYDPETEQWSDGPDFPGDAFHGFGLSAWNLNGKLYAGGMEGVLYRLSDDEADWEKVDEFQTKRFFHQLVPDGRGGLLAVAGASPEVGRTASIERLDLVFAETASTPPPTEDEPTNDQARESDEASAIAPQPDSNDNAAVSAAACPPDRWPGFRGIGTSVTAADDLPLAWSDEDGVAWKIELPGYGQSSPVVWGERVFVTTMQGEEKDTPTILCFELATGEELWRREYASSQTVVASNYVSRSAPTPCLDAERLYAFFESGDLFALTHAGDPVWSRSLVDEYGRIEGNHGIGGSPILAGDRLLVPMLHGGPSYLLAARKDTGETTWKADFDARVAWSSPCLANGLAVISGSGSIDAYDLKTGEERWRIDSLEGNNVPSPSVADDLMVIGAQNRSSNLAFRFGERTEPSIDWRSELATSSFASPLVYRGYVYFVSKAGVAVCVNSRDGVLAWKQRLPGSCWASPLAADDRVYFFGKEGETSVYAADGVKEELAGNRLTVTDNSRVYGVAATDSNLLVRTGKTLTCIR
ncbi:MAG: PQQ-binding-like beta-propeller repeat protein [Planctomycetota bacterium]